MPMASAGDCVIANLLLGRLLGRNLDFKFLDAMTRGLSEELIRRLAVTDNDSIPSDASDRELSGFGRRMTPTTSL